MQVLVTDPSPIARRLIKEELCSGDYTVLEAESSDQARRILLAEPNIALMTLGTVLPKMSGFNFLKEVNTPEFRKSLKKGPNDHLPVVFVTSNDNDSDRLLGYDIGAADFIEKPWAKGKLLGQVNSLLGHNAEMQEMSVLVVDDSEMTRRIVCNCLGQLGVAIHEADDGNSALEFLKTNTVDLVLTDLIMQHMHGDELCLKIRKSRNFSDLPVIILSAIEDKAQILTLFKVGATDFLSKPFLQEELMARLKVHLERVQLTRALHTVARISTDESIPNVVADENLRGHGSDNTDGQAQWRVLLVDDSTVSIAVGTRLLQKMGCDVTVATRAAQALGLIRTADTTRFDMVLMDLVMPEMGGREATRAIREWEAELDAADPAFGRPLPIVALSASDQDTQLATCLEAGMNDFLAKPFKVDKIRAALQSWARRPTTSAAQPL